MARWIVALLTATIVCGGAAAAYQATTSAVRSGTPSSDDTRALLIGIGSYPNYADIEHLRYASSDAAKLQKLVEAGWLGSMSSVQVLQESHATAARIRAELAALAVVPHHRVVIFFAGHGLQDSRGITYLMPWDGNPDAPQTTAIAAAEFAESVKRIIADEVILFVDACNSGGLGVYLGEGLKDAGTISHQVGLFSAAADARSYEQPAAGAGVFTYALEYGIGGAGDTNKDGKTTAGELATYVENQVYTLVSEAIPVPGLRQRPVRSPVFDEALVISVPPPPKPVTGPPAPPAAPGWLRIPQYAGPVVFTFTGLADASDVEITLTDRADDTKYRIVMTGNRGTLERLAPGTYGVAAQSQDRVVYRGTLIVPPGQGSAVAAIDVGATTNRVSYQGGTSLQIR
jgi:hypothetical protein